MEFFAVEVVIMPTNGNSRLKPIGVRRECVRTFTAACDELNRGR